MDSRKDDAMNSRIEELKAETDAEIRAGAAEIDRLVGELNAKLAWAASEGLRVYPDLVRVNMKMPFGPSRTVPQFKVSLYRKV